METPLTKIIGIALTADMQRRLEALASQERITVAKLAVLGLSTYLEVLSDEAIVDQIRGVRPIPQSA